MENSKLNLTNYQLVEGDMILPKKHLFKTKINSHSRRKRKIMKATYASGFSSRWPLKTVPYEFDYEIGDFLNLIIIHLFDIYVISLPFRE